MSKLLSKDVVGGLALFAVGLFFFALSFDYRIGTARQMGPGYFPMLLGGTMMALAAVIVFLGLRDGGAFSRPQWRASAAAIGSILAFGLGMAWFGLAPAIVLTIAVASLGDPDSRPHQTAILAAIMATAAWLVFTVLLRLPLTIFKSPF